MLEKDETGGMREARRRGGGWWLYGFVIIEVASPSLLFLPGMQVFRTGIRALPFLASIAMLVVYRKRINWRSGPPGTKALLGALLVIGMGLFHPLANPVAGAAQWMFQICIAAPVLWGAEAVTDLRTLRRMVWLLFLGNGLSAGVGVLQVYDGERFMPPEFSRTGVEGNRLWVQSMTYYTEDGRAVVRPPGLTDLPGGAAYGGTIAGLVGLLLAGRPRAPLLERVFCIGMAGVGYSAVYLCQIRSLLIMAVLMTMLMIMLLFGKGRVVQALAMMAVSIGLILGSYWWAVSLGGYSIAERYGKLLEVGLIESYKTNRGQFLQYTFTELLVEHPLGAGAGRWGMMNALFSRWDTAPSPRLYAEIQGEGWTVDGGAVLILLYGSAIFISLREAFRKITANGDDELSYWAGAVFCMNLFVAGQSLASPTFNTQMGVQFWMLAAGLHGACRGVTETGQGRKGRAIPRTRPGEEGGPARWRRSTNAAKAVASER